MGKNYQPQLVQGFLNHQQYQHQDGLKAASDKKGRGSFSKF